MSGRWYRWASLDGFNGWHSAAKALLGLPKPGQNQGNGQTDDAAQWTTDYTQPVVLAADDVRAWVGDDVATAIKPPILGDPCDPPPPQLPLPGSGA